jgi:hypothetical protein
MYLFSRSASVGGAKIRDAMAWAASVNAKVNQISGLEVGLWSQTFSPRVGTLVWSTLVPDLATLESANDKLMVDDAYMELLDAGRDHVMAGSVDDYLGAVIHFQGDPARPAEYATVARTTIAAGKLARGIALGVEISQRAEQITGLPTMFTADATGNYAGVAWLSAYADVAELDRASQLLNSNPEFIDLLDSNAPGVYADHPGASTQTIYRHIC